MARHAVQQRASRPRASASAHVPSVPAVGRGTPRFLRYRLAPAALAKPASQQSEQEAAAFAQGRGGTPRRSQPHEDGGSLARASIRAASASLPGGAPLTQSERHQFETSLGGDLGGVRLHTDSAAGALADAAGANAFTLGQDIYFGRGKYQPGTPAGDRLLAHEMAHVAQHGPADRHQLHADLAMSLPTSLGVFGIDMADRVAPATPGMEGHITFDPDPTGPYSAEIGLVQAATIIDVTGARGAPGDPWQFRTPGNVNRNVLGTTGSALEARGWHIDTTYEDPAKVQSSAVSPSYPESVGFSPAHNEHGWLRSPTDTHAASLYDYPGFPGVDIDYQFETVAKAMDNQTVYGALHWGFELRSGAPGSEYAYTLDNTSAEFDIALDRFRAFFTHEPVIIYFDTNVDVPAAGEAAKLDEAMHWLNEFPDAHVDIEGFADERGPTGLNLGLSQRRADSVAGQLMARGLAPLRIDRSAGAGETTGFAAGAEAGQLQANRRVRIRFIRTASSAMPP